jgi:hypothetical protein
MEIGDWDIEVVRETIVPIDKLDSVEPVTNLMIEYSCYHKPTKITIRQTITYIEKKRPEQIIEFLTNLVAKLKLSHIDTLDRRLPSEVFHGNR